ncbi:ATP-binding cassette domain-containing protein [Flavobacterium sp. TP390]|uniref:ATP-binding cassette domain-containing protein n=2 Tax=Flavobacterium profundi TaxID=1774945 RepID=A0A6I4IDQ5_9FLAO|nr:ATP-binding cassette domain-containing protein [Flavobacterium profundi]
MKCCMKIKKALDYKLRIVSFYFKYIKFGIFFIIFLSFLTGILESIGVSMIFPILQAVLDTNNSVKELNFPIVSDVLSFFNVEYSIRNLTLIFVSLFIIKAFFKFFTGYIKLHYSSKFLLDIRKKLIKKLSGLDYANYTKRETGKLSSTFTLEVENLVSGFIYFSNYLVTIFTGLSFIFIILFIEYRFAISILFFGAIYYLGFKKLNIKIKDISKEITYHNAKFNSLLIQFIQSFKYLKSTNNFSNLSTFLSDTVSKIRSLKIQKDIRTNFVSAIQEPAVLVLVLFIVFISVNYIKIETSIVLMLLVLFYRSTNYFLTSQSTWNNFLSQIGSTNSVIDLENSLIENQEMNKGDLEPHFLNQITVKNVSFKYTPEEYTLQSINFTVPINKTIAFVGKSGTGKSTLVNILTGLLKPDEGNVFLDAVELNAIDVNRWRNTIGYITQESVIFNDTILNNITSWNYNPVKDKAKLWEVIKMSHLDEIITTEKDLLREVGDRGVSLSGGQKQRIAIARELYRNPKILILDEATSALDSETENNIIESLEQLNGKITIIVIAHRLSTIKKADEIYVLEKGKIIENGTYNELLNRNNSRMAEFIKMQELK